MVYYNNKDEEVLWNLYDILGIGMLIGDIQYIDGYLEATRWAEKPGRTTQDLALMHSQRALELIRRYRQLPKELQDHLLPNTIPCLEAICKSFLNRE